MAIDTRSALLDAAEQAARARGINGFSYADLAESVGIRKASIHYHFPTKADLAAALMDRYHDAMQTVCAEIDGTYDTASERLLALVRVYRGALNEGETLCLCVSFSASRESLSDDVVGGITAFRKMMVAWIGRVFDLAGEDGSIRGAADPAHEAMATLALLEGAQLAAHVEADPAAFDEAVALLGARCRPD